MPSGALERALAVVIVVLSPVVAVAQTTGAIAGEVKDTSGAVLPGVTVEVASAALIEKIRTAVTDGSGNYKSVDLRPGAYSITFSLTGFATAKREGVDLTAGFTATVNAEMRVGGLEETVLVSGQTPVVDVQNTREQRVMTRELIDTIPTAKSIVNMAAVLPGITIIGTTGSGQDVGGSAGENFQGMTSHGGRRNDQQTLMDGMSVAMLNFFGGSVTPTALGDGTVEQTIIEVSGHSAEVETGGVVVTLVPKQGGNTLHTNLFANFATEATQSNNYTDELKTRGLATPLPIKQISDFNPTLGGPIKRDRLWFFAAFRDLRDIIYTDPATKGYNLNPNGWTFVPDLTRRPVKDALTSDQADRITWQISTKHKLAYMYNYNHKTEHDALGANVTQQSTTQQHYVTNINQITWSAPLTSRLLLDAGISLSNDHHYKNPGPNAVGPSATEASTGITFRAVGYGQATNPQTTPQDEQINHHVYRGAISYVTGAHAFKAGAALHRGYLADDFFLPPNNVDYQVTLLNGSPTSITFLPTPFSFANYMYKSDVFGQDQWRIRDLTLNLGL